MTYRVGGYTIYFGRCEELETQDPKQFPCCQNTGKKKHRNWRDEKTVQDLSKRLNRIEGQVRGIKRMIEEGVYCDDVLNQIASAQSALSGVAKLLLEKHIKFCIKDQLMAGDEEVVFELTKTIARLLNKS